MDFTVLGVVRRRARLTQIDLAQQVGCTQAEISMVERGKITPRPETLQKIASVLKVPEDELLMDYVEWSNEHLTPSNL